MTFGPLWYRCRCSSALPELPLGEGAGDKEKTSLAQLLMLDDVDEKRRMTRPGGKEQVQRFFIDCHVNFG
ncbi:hypothetical protein M569_08781 [Genlisea aurea]|uniref:Uncharacterized protein n=1 Tax=Genlisea aurea TaxID=192259 RepID=S8CGD5_9LAMI|nr:hypothetical protein M569_08781 [Genlisea aurea]